MGQGLTLTEPRSASTINMRHQSLPGARWRGKDITLKQSLWQKHIAITQEHGSWVFLFSPLLIGLFAGGRWTAASGWLVLSALAVFLFRQPVTVLVKVWSKRRSTDDLAPALFWSAVYGALALIGLVGLWAHGQARLAILALPGLPVFVWHLILVARRAERRQLGVEIVASGVLALAAPAAFWIGRGALDPMGWWLWALTWFQSAASIVYAALRLEQRPWKTLPPVRARLRVAARALAYTGFNLVAVIGLALAGVLPPLLPLPFLLQAAETIYGALQPAAGVKPTRIGVRQLIVSTLFTVLFIVVWRPSAA